MKRLIRTPFALLLIPLLLAGCAGAPGDEPALEQARQELRQLAADEQVRGQAPNLLFDAEQALEQAAAAEDAQTREHYLYIARQRMAIARTIAERRTLFEQTESLIAERDRLQLSTREQELEQARTRAQELESELAALEAKQTDIGYLITLSEVFFQTDDTQVQPGTEQTLDKLARFLRDNPDQQMVVAGHTDSTGPASYNQQLSEQRAEAVKEAIVARGIPPDRVSTIGYGERRPIASNENPGGRQLNRRVEIILPQSAS